LLRDANAEGTTITGVVGGPPCQGFSHIGLKAKADPRNELLCDFFRLVAEINPAFFLAENVPGVLDERNAPLLRRAQSQIPKKYVVLEPFTVRASDWGAPTTRTRVFFYGYDPGRVNGLGVGDFTPTRTADVRVGDALAHLPGVRAAWQSEPQSWRKVGELDRSYFASRVVGHVPTGIGDSGAIERFRKKREVSGFLGTVHQKSTVRRFDALRPGQCDRVSKCTRLDPAGYCPTLRAGTGSERGSYQAIRPVHPRSPRVITPREGARLQGFPDWFQFHPTKWHAFRQLGNSVSPIVAECLLKKIYDAMY
jgi:DNA (cytosine-5)-methyltransferase 1